jgi:hypothetical protein
MPDEIAFKTRNLELVVVHFGDHALLPEAFDLARLVERIDRDTLTA